MTSRNPDVAVMGEAIEQRRGHLGIAEHARPFAEGEIGGDQDRGALVEPADEVKEKLAAGLGERQVAELVEDEVHAAEIIGDEALGPARASASSWLTRSTVMKKRPRRPARTQLRAMAITACVLPVPVPPMNTALRCWAMKPPPARSRTRASLIGVSLKAKSSRFLASGSLEAVI